MRVHLKMSKHNFCKTMTINATLINLYHVCKRECWLHANGITMEHSSDIVADGKLLHETSYPQRNQKHSEFTLNATVQDIELFGKIDFYDASEKVIHETKRSNKVEIAHIWQAKFYLWLLELNGIQNAKAIIEYPLLRSREIVTLTKEDVDFLKTTLTKISNLKNSEACPPVLNAKICKSCSYYDLCYVTE